MSLGLSLVGTYGARGNQKRAAAPAAWLNEVMQWVERTHGAQLAAAPVVHTEGDEPLLLLVMHPCAEPIEIVAPDRGAVRVTATTSSAGPGYHQFVCSLLDALAADFGVTWAAEESEASEDETGYFLGRDRAGLEEAMLAWISAVCAAIVAPGSGHGEGAVSIAMPMGSVFEHNGFVLTALGPRDRAWVEGVARDRRKGAEFFAWWEEGETARVLVDRALALMWTEVRWGPAMSEDDYDVQRDAAEMLAEAYAQDTSVEYPWREWAELMKLVEWEGEPREAVEARAARADASRPLIGYRRGDVRVALPGGWSLRLPGGFSEGYEEEEREYVASDGDRTVRFSGMRMARGAGAPTMEELLKDPLPPIQGADEEVTLEPWMHGRVAARGVIAKITEDEEGRRCWMLASVVVTDGHMGLLSIFFDDARHREWALEVWKGITHPGGEVADDMGDEGDE